MLNLVDIRQNAAEICRFSIFHDGGRRHLGFFKFQILTVGRLKRAELRRCAKFVPKSVKTRPRYGDYSILQDGGRRHLGFLNFKFLTVGRLKRLNCVAMPNLVEIGQNAAEIWRFSVIQDGGRRHL